jgi:hypothetical protein
MLKISLQRSHCWRRRMLLAVIVQFDWCKRSAAALRWAVMIGS